MNILRLSIYQPQAHYRIPFTYQRRHTYPLPPYSTLIGFLINILGIDDQRKPLYGELKRIKISIAGNFSSKITEYIWFRNLSLKKHIDRFGYVENRYSGGHIDHIGGQSPISIDVLNDVRLTIYLAHDNFHFLQRLKRAFENPCDRLEILHLGRAEDWIVLEDEPAFIKPDSISFIRRDANYHNFFWIPRNVLMDNYNSNNSFDFRSIDGLLYNLPTFWEVIDFDNTFSRHGERDFDYMQTKLNDGLLKGCCFLFDNEKKLPFFLADFNKEREKL